MFAVELVFNTDENNRRLEDPVDYPSVFYGPFFKKERAEYFLQNVFEDDTDVSDARLIELNPSQMFLKF